MILQDSKTGRGFRRVTAPTYTGPDRPLVAQESSAVGDYEGAVDRPGSSFLWIGDTSGHRAHLNREGVEEFIAYLRGWLETGELSRNVTEVSRAVTTGHGASGDAGT